MFRNLAAFAVIGILLQFAERTRFGQQALDAGFDYLVKNNYSWAVLERHEKTPVSPDLRLVIFDKETYTSSYTQGYWTPRDEVGLTLLNTIQRGASLVLLDFSFTGDAPVVLKGGTHIDGTTEYLRYLGEAAALARKNKAIIKIGKPPALPGDSQSLTFREIEGSPLL